MFRDLALPGNPRFREDVRPVFRQCCQCGWERDELEFYEKLVPHQD
jgi:hypothetical protein